VNTKVKSLQKRSITAAMRELFPEMKRSAATLPSNRFGLLWLLGVFAAAPAWADGSGVETVVVTASALPGGTIDPNAIPAATQSLAAGDLTRGGPASLLRALEGAGNGVSLSNAQDNPLQPNLYYRGFQASPLAGDAQGLAVYVDGVRFNQSFGDAVSWDLIPDIAIEGATVEGSNPVFGLNALGGSISLRMKDGFSWDGVEAEASGGSFDRYDLGFQYGRQDGDFSVYAAGHALHETGWRDHSPSRLGQAFADVGWHRGGAEVHLDLVGADTNLTGNGSSPVQLLAVDRAAVFTWPDTQKNAFGLANLFGSYQVSTALSLQGNAYLDHLRQRTVNGDASDLAPCDDGSGFLCLNDNVATDANGNPIPDFLNGGTYAQLNQTSTSSVGFGTALQAIRHAPLFGRANQLLAGASYDGGRTDFAATSEVGAMTIARTFQGPGIVIHQHDGSIAPVSISGENDYAGLYLADIFKPIDPLTITVSARYNLSRITLHDRLGTALDGDHQYSRVNPAIGATYDVSSGATLYAGYAEANRAPTPAEFSCADSRAPCSLTNFFVADPALKQVVAHTVEAGVRGRGDGGANGTFSWHAGYFHVDAADDILFAASPIAGRAFFENIGSTTRQGAEVSGNYARGPWRLSLGYTYMDATFGDALTLNSGDNPRADAGGRIFVKPGDHLPGIPASLLKVSADYQANADWMIGLDGRYAAGQWLRGDESNLNPKTPPYFVVDLTTRYRVGPRIELFASIENLLDAKYETFGSFSPTADVPIAEAPSATNPRSLSPAPPISAYAGVRLTL
jgi:outer membrane receptor protein involved in Fe transport